MVVTTEECRPAERSKGRAMAMLDVVGAAMPWGFARVEKGGLVLS